MGWLYIESDLTLWKNLQLRFWFWGMDLFARAYWRSPWPKPGSKETWGALAYLHCAEKAGGLSYGQAPPGPHAPFPD